MSDFKGEPVLILESMDDLREALAKPDWYSAKGMYKYHVKSLWLVKLIDGMIAELGGSRDFVYNADVRIEAEDRLGGYPKRTQAEYCQEGTPLSTLIYNAQCYHRSDALYAAGYVPFTDGLIEEAGEGGKIVTMSGTILTVKRIDGKLYAMKPRVRKYAVQPMGQAVRMLKAACHA